MPNIDLKNAERTEEVQEIIGRMPNRFGIKITIFVVLIMIIFCSFGWIIKYPDVVTGEIVINAESSPIKLVANSSGRINLLNSKDMMDVQPGSYIAVIQNSANYSDVLTIKSILVNFKGDGSNNEQILKILPRNVSLGELNIKYFTFVNSLSQFVEYRVDNSYNKQNKILQKLLDEYRRILDISKTRSDMSGQNLSIMNKLHNIDTGLLSKKVLSQLEKDRSQINLIAAQEGHQNMLKDVSLTTAQLQQTQSQLEQNILQQRQKESQLTLDLLTSFAELEDNIKAWEHKYVFKAPMTGKLQFLKFWNTDQFIQNGESAFTVVPSKNHIIGQMTLLASGAGKVKKGQEVIIKLDNYPYMEYGSIKGRVSSISLTTNPISTKEGMKDTYLVSVDLPDRLKTNYGSELDFRFEIKGTGDIVANQRKLIERLFDNLRYKVNE
ncbi:putative hemolysin secretion protein [Pedobacter sp. BAL39]|uniref:HlyD family efflux transporter periplasmic adaptor subunit n=1 Tax=Pedobacter sp. BAL39 TaxID=391596 RepID=UPI0001559CB4|nr:HlyD family efflux transporter periplasmic adaptor subunit [Pedobacter sp. BAL39]EDM37811.1 putative hemolysin secretion protein [Pedobacter sp. BAL39]